MTSTASCFNSVNSHSVNIGKEENSHIYLNDSDIKDEPFEETLYDELERKLKVRCGEVFALLGERLILVCTFCEENFNDMQLLGAHLFVKHEDKFFMKEENTEPTLSVILKESAEVVATNGIFTHIATNASKYRETLQRAPKNTCNICGLNFKHNINLLRHQQKCKKNRDVIDPSKDEPSKRDLSMPNRYQCETCGVAYKNRRNLVRHAKKGSCGQGNAAESRENITKLSRKDSETSITNSPHSGDVSINEDQENSYNETFLDVLILEKSDRDSRSTSPERNNYSCDTCSLTFSDEAKLKSHLQIHLGRKLMKPEDPELYCKKCERQFDSKKAMSNHQRLHRQLFRTQEQVSVSTGTSDSNIPKNPDLFCNQCNQFFRNKKQLYMHADSHESVPSVLENDEEFLKCKYCWKQFSKYNERKAHEATHTGTRPYECPFCHKGFASHLSRKSHFRVHTGESPHQCDQCKKVFRDNHDLRRHIQRHLNIRNVACELCEKKFFNKHQLTLHMRTHTKERPYVCEDCGKTFVVMAQLKDHQLRHTGIKNVKCEVCGRLFYSNSVLKVHMASHSDEKPFECDVCGRRFSRAKAMQKHMKLHSGVKKYVCNICGKAYAQDSGLYAHRKTHARQL